MRYHLGMTLLELLITISIASLILSLALPGFLSHLDQKRVSASAQNFMDDLRHTRQEAISASQVTTVSLSAGNNWCYGLNALSECDCTQANSCSFNDGEYVKSSDEFEDVVMAVDGFTGPVSKPYVQFDGVRGGVVNSGSVNFSLRGESVSVSVNTMGQVQACSATVPGYPAC